MSTRRFDHMIFMGSGAESEADCRALHERLDYGLSLLSGLQQGGARRGTKDYRWAIKEIGDVVRDVGAALGMDIRVLGELPT